MNFRGQIFSGVYYPEDVRDEKVSSALATLGRLGVIECRKKIRSQKFILSTLNVGVFEMQIREFLIADAFYVGSTY